MTILRHALITIALLCVTGATTVADDLQEMRLAVEAAPSGEPVLHIRFPTMVGIRYELSETHNLLDWEDTNESIVGDGSEQGFAVITRKPASHFRVKAVLADSLVSAITEIEYPIRIYVPDGYDSNTGTYPVIYATDGQWISDGFSGAIAAKDKQVILVTIEQGPNDRRAIDYRLPGATKYYQVLITELIPAVERMYRVDPDKRTLSGTSYGGLLVGLVLLMDDVDTPRFKNYLSFDGSFWTHRAATAALEQARFDASTSMNVTLYLTSALGVQNNDRWVTSFKNTLESRGYAGLTIIRRSYNVTHNDVAQPSFEEALDVLFE